MLLIRQKTSYKKGYFKETLIKAKRAYTGYMLKAVYMTNDSDQFFNVENLALHYYGKQGWNGVHSENNLMRYLYGVLFWDEIYYPKVPYVFQTPY